MNILTTEINIGESINIVENVELNKTSNDIKGLKDVSINLVLYKESEISFILSGIIKGIMFLEDAISLEKIEYPFLIELDKEEIEINELNEKKLDIIQVLWDNILLEVPSRITNVTDYSKYQGTGWKLISLEEGKLENNPFKDLII